MSQVIDRSPLEAGREAIVKHEWREGFDLLSEADKTGDLGPEDLQLLAEAAWWSGRLEDCISARQRAFSGYMESGRPRSAALMALALFDDYLDKRAGSIAEAWFSRAEGILQQEPESVEHGLLEAQRAHRAMLNGDLDQASKAADKALELGMRFGNRDVQAFGLLLGGNILVNRGDVDGGLKKLDEATIAAVGGELNPHTAGMVYCLAIATTAQMADYDRAGQLTEASMRWCERQSISGFPGICRVHRAEIMRLRGSWLEAEQEARRALTELRDFNLEFAAAGFYEVGEIRLRIGDLLGAQEAFKQAHELGHEPQPGLALLRLAEGQARAAFSSLKRALEEPLSKLDRARLLPGMVEIAIAAGELGAARASVLELETIIETYHSHALRAAHLCSLGALLLAEGDAAGAAKTLKQSWRLWAQADLPYEAARARLAYGAALRAEGDEDAALLEIGAARTAFQKLGAELDVRRASDMLGEEVSDSLPIGSAPGARMVKTFMFTDIVGSTRLADAMGERPWSRLLAWHDRALRELFEKHRGEEVKHLGDGFFVAFDEPSDAVECAVKIQLTLDEHSETAGFAPDIRIGLHRAEATRKGNDYEGKGVHEAARVGAIAGAGEIVASEPVILKAVSRFPVSELRPVNVKGFSKPIRVASINPR
ncbi:MAG: adenylate/guanylate cyclase domain-containing protein [Actinomycetota bacterium]